MTDQIASILSFAERWEKRLCPKLAGLLRRRFDDQRRFLLGFIRRHGRRRRHGRPMHGTVGCTASLGLFLVSRFERASSVNATLGPRQNTGWWHGDGCWLRGNQYAGGGRETGYLRDDCSTWLLPEGRRNQQTNANNEVGHRQFSSTRNSHIDAERVSDDPGNQTCKGRRQDFRARPNLS
jgi:hypothetical protein